MWDVNKLLAKYPIKNMWEWKFTGNVITSVVCLHDIKEDPWNREWEKNTKWETYKPHKDTYFRWVTVDKQKIDVYLVQKNYSI